MFLFLIIDFDKELIEYENKHELIARTKHFPGMNTYKCRYKLKQVRLYTCKQQDFGEKNSIRILDYRSPGNIPINFRVQYTFPLE